MPIRMERGDTIDDARDRYLQSFQQQQRQVKHKPSLFLAPFKKRQDRSKIKERPLSAGFISVRSGSRQTRTEPTIDIFDEFGMPKQKKEKRSISNSIKDKLKKVFRRTSNNGQKSRCAENPFMYG
jgi:Flp pilus assembly secretin CpaC